MYQKSHVGFCLQTGKAMHLSLRSIAIFFDLAKDLDTVSHEILIDKPESGTTWNHSRSHLILSKYQ